jgi:hypothetical protein
MQSNHASLVRANLKVSVCQQHLESYTNVVGALDGRHPNAGKARRRRNNFDIGLPREFWNRFNSILSLKIEYMLLIQILSAGRRARHCSSYDCNDQRSK